MSIFLVMGILILFFVGFMLFMRSLTIPTPKEEDYSGYAATEVEGFVNKCLLQSAMLGLQLIGAQGGVIYKSQGGVTPDSFKTTRAFYYNGSYILIGISPGEFQPGHSCVPTHPSSVYDPQQCPSVAFPFVSTDSPEISFDQRDTRPPPAYPGFLRLFNRFNLPGLYPREEYFLGMSPTWQYVGNDNSIYTNLKIFVENNITKCLDFSTFEDAGIDVQPEGELEVTPIIAEDDVSFALNYPLLVRYKGKEITMERFYVNTKVRLKPVYRFIEMLLWNEAKNFSFDILRPNIMAPAGVSYEVRMDVENMSDVLVVEDAESLVPSRNGEGFVPFVFFSVIENSQPAISYIHYQNLDVVPGLRENIINCPYLTPRENPWEETTSQLMAEIGTNMTRKAIECLWLAYRRALGVSYERAYDPDDDMLTWDFKTANCGWNQECQYKGSNLFFDNYLDLRFSDGMYTDTLHIPLELYDHPPKVSIVDKGYLDIEQPLLGISVHKILYLINGTDEDIVWGTDVDDIQLTITGYPVAPIVKENSSMGHTKLWGVAFENLGHGYDVTFTVTDKYGKSDSVTITVS